MEASMRSKCPICHAQSRTFLRHEDSFGRNVRLKKCVRCGHGFYSRHYSQAELQQIYADDYADGYIGGSEDQILREREYIQDVDRLLAEAPELETRSISVLDIGCSSGSFLDAMPDKWKKSGTEVNSAYLSKLAQERPGWNVTASLSRFGEQKFDLITLRGVIEHIQNHDELVAFVRRAISPGGYVFVTATPDFSSPAAVLYNEMWNQIICPEHVHQFTHASLVLLLATSGLSPVSISHPYRNSVYANPNADAQLFLRNFYLSTHRQVGSERFRHAFPGNMMTCVFQMPDEDQENRTPTLSN